MMKKLMVLSMVLAVAGLSSAALVNISLAPEGNTVGIYVDSHLSTVGVVVWDAHLEVIEWAFTPKGDGNLSNVMDAGNLNRADFGWGDGQVRVLQVNPASDVADPLEPGVQWIVTFNLAPGQYFSKEDMGLGLGRVDLYAEDMATLLDTVYVVPEPMTMGLLGLGALFLRRRK